MHHKDKIAWRSALLGICFSLPFFVTNAIVTLRINPWYSILEAFPHVRNSPFLPLGLLLFFPVGAYIAATPLLPKKPGAKSRMITTNFIVTFLLLAAFTILVTALGWELYRCDVLHIPQCD